MTLNTTAYKNKKPVSTNRRVCSYPFQAVHGITLSAMVSRLANPHLGPRMQILAEGSATAAGLAVSHPEARALFLTAGLAPNREPLPTAFCVFQCIDRSHFTNCSLGNHSAFQEETLATWLQWDFVPRHGQLREGCGPYRVGCHQQRAQREVLTLTAAIEGFFPSPAGG